MLSLVIERHLFLAAQWHVGRLLRYTSNMPPEREASPDLQHYNLAIEKGRAAKEEAGDLVMVPSGFRACGWSAGKTALSRWLMVGNSEARSEGEAYVARPCNLNAQYCRVFNESKARLNAITQSFSCFYLGSNPGILNHKTPQEKIAILISDEQATHFTRATVFPNAFI